MVLPDGFGKCERGHNRVWILTLFFLTGFKVFPTDKGPKKTSMWKVLIYCVLEALKIQILLSR